MSERNAEVLLVDALSRQVAAPVSLSVPSPRPSEFVTVERVGGGFSGVGRSRSDRPLLAVQYWAASRLEASDGAKRLSEVLQVLSGKGRFARINVTSVTNFPSEKQPRYQLLVDCFMRP